MKSRTLKIVGALLALTLTVGACGWLSDEGGTAPAAVEQDQDTASRQLDRFNTAQPVPEFDWSQVRQNLIEISTAQAETTATTTFFFNMGVAAPIFECPSIGYPLPSTFQLTNPDQLITHRSGTSGSYAASIPQVESIGVYTGDSTGTYAICVDPSGNAYANYWEGFVQTVTGPAVWNDETQSIELVGAPSFDFSEGRER